MKNNKKRYNIDRALGSYLLTTSIASVSASALLISPSLIPRLTSIGSVYQNYRFTKLDIHMLPVCAPFTNGNGEWVLGYSSDVSSTNSITTTPEVSECYPSGVQSLSGSATSNTPAYFATANVKLTSRHLCGDGSLKWWKVVGDSDTNAWENFQGQLVIYNQTAATVAFKMLVHYVCEFSSPISSLLTRSLPVSTILANAKIENKERPNGEETTSHPKNSDQPCKTCCNHWLNKRSE